MVFLIGVRIFAHKIKASAFCIDATGGRGRLSIWG
ncbi:hypothetical protein ARTHRO8AJ_390111 [Arthrobacter sp. 8AJ]|nr:hypothetical protein ARTHRO8AJ_390111 [Arthrobacter sp. 8AJ]